MHGLFRPRVDRLRREVALLRERARRGQLDLVQQALGRVRGQRPLRAERRGGLLRALDLRLRVLPRPVELRP